MVTDSQAAILRIDSTTGERTVIASGGNLVQPFAAALDAQGNLLVSDTGSSSVVRINPATGAQTVMASGGVLGSPYGIALDSRGDILVANSVAIIRIDSARRTTRIVSSGGAFIAPLGIAVALSGDIYVADAGGLLLKVNPASGAQRLISAGGNLVNPIGIIFDRNGQIIVADFSSGNLVQVNSQTGAQTVLLSDELLVGTVGVAMDLAGRIIISNPDAFDFDGGIILYDPQAGGLTPIAVGSGDFVNPRCITVVHVSLLEQLCPCAGPTPNRTWKNHGEYLAFAAKRLKQAANAGVMSDEDARAYMQQAVHSNCGKKETSRRSAAEGVEIRSPRFPY